MYEHLPAPAPALVEARVTLTQSPLTVGVGGAAVLALVPGKKGQGRQGPTVLLAPLVIRVVVVLVVIVIIGRVMVVMVVTVPIPTVALVPDENIQFIVECK